jgi:S1-C subfamily serine protease
LFKGDHFETNLDPVGANFTGSIAASVPAGHSTLSPELSLETLAAATKPAVVQLKGLQLMGSGFFVTETGVIATNAHVARDEGSLLVLLASGQQLDGKVVYIDEDLDIALVKVEGAVFHTWPLRLRIRCARARAFSLSAIPRARCSSA